MKTTSIITILTLAASLLFGSCDSFLDLPSKEQLDDKSVFESETNADLFLAIIYASLPDYESETQKGLTPGSYEFNYDRFDNWSDDASCDQSWYGSWSASRDRAYTPDSYGVGTNAPIYSHQYPCVPFIYSDVYGNIRACNKFIKGLEENRNNFSANWYARRMGEVKFLRAYFYHLVWMAYGGVPIITEPLNFSEMGDQIFCERAASEPTAQFIIDELQEIIDNDMLPDIPSQGRATYGAVVALKGWVEMFDHRYEAAVDTYNRIIGGIYSLYTTPHPSQETDNQLGAYTAQFFQSNNNNCESIFAIQHQSGVINSNRNSKSGPRYSQATYSLVQDYRMSDGLPREESSLWNDRVNMPDFRFYDNREARFYQTIVYKGCKWRTGVFNNDAEGSTTGFITCKGIDQTIPLTEVGNDGANTPLFRYAEVLLLYAEARIELGQIDQSVYDAINEVRLRGGIPSLDESYNTPQLAQQLTDKESMRKIVRRERRIEFAFESKRYWDLIRWGKASEPTNYYTAMVELNKPKQGASYNSAGTLVVHTIHECRFNQHNYLFPIPRINLEQNPKMMAQNGAEWINGQNPGYAN